MFHIKQRVFKNIKLNKLYPWPSWHYLLVKLKWNLIIKIYVKKKNERKIKWELATFSVKYLSGLQATKLFTLKIILQFTSVHLISGNLPIYAPKILLFIYIFTIFFFLLSSGNKNKNETKKKKPKCTYSLYSSH